MIFSRTSLQKKRKAKEKETLPPNRGKQNEKKRRIECKEGGERKNLRRTVAETRGENNERLPRSAKAKPEEIHEEE